MQTGRPKAGKMTESRDRAIAISLAAVAGAMALAEKVLRLTLWETWTARLAILAALAVAAAWDWRTGLVPRSVLWPLLAGAAGRAAVTFNLPGLAALVVALWDLRPADRRVEWLLYAAMAGGAAALSAATGDDTAVLTTITWLAMYRVWRAGWMGGGDAMLIMGLVGLYPATGVLVSIGVGWLIIGLVQMARVYGRAFFPALYHALVQTASPRPVPRERLQQEGVPMAAGIALGWALAVALDLFGGAFRGA